LLQEGGEIMCVRLRKGEHRLDIGNFLSYFQAFMEVSLADREHGEALRAWAKARLRRGGKTT
jgi:UTP-glucose-1-phosphate uridylyltransferase